MRTLFVFLTAVIFISCGNRINNKNDAEGRSSYFEITEPPAMLQGRDRLDFILAHYWDKFDFSDSDAVTDKDRAEGFFADYLYILNEIPNGQAVSSMRKFISEARKDSTVYAYFFEMSEKYLHDPNSPYRNEELFIPVLEDYIDNESVEDIYKMRPRAQLAMAMKNRTGHKAADISVRTASGSVKSLYGLNTELVLIYINNPDCHMCAEITEELKNSDMIMPLVRTSRLAVLAVYPDEDVNAWRDNLNKFPGEWIVGYDYKMDMRNNSTYDLRAIPSLYLVDKDKTVLIKDGDNVREIENYLLRAGY